MIEDVERIRREMAAARAAENKAATEQATAAAIEAERHRVEMETARKALGNATTVIRSAIKDFNLEWESTGVALNFNPRADESPEGAIDVSGINLLKPLPDVSLHHYILFYGTLDCRVVLEVRKVDSDQKTTLHDGPAADLTVPMAKQRLGEYIKMIYTK